MPTISKGEKPLSKPQESDPHVSSAGAMSAHGINVVPVSDGEKSWCFMRAIPQAWKIENI